MKLFKKTAGILMAMLMTVFLTTTAFADDVDLSTHTFKAYQIFTGTQSDTGDSDVDVILSDIQWGDGIDSANFLAELQSEYDLYDSCKTAEDVAKVLSNYLTYDNAEARAFAKIADKHLVGTGYDTGATLDAGYYLVVDTTVTDDSEDDAKNLSLLQLTNKGTFDIENKTDIPKVEKKVQEEDYPTYRTTDAETGVTGYPLTNGYNDVADYDIGDTVPFELIGTMPTTLADYDTYNYIFHDTLSKGLTFNDDVKVYLVNTTSKTEVTKSFTISNSVANDGTTKITVFCADVKTIADVSKDSMFVVEYTAILNKDAEIGLDGNPNEVYLEYSNNPNNKGEGDTGKTKKDKVIVFTYELDGNKIDSEDATKTLKDAKFILQRTSDDKYYVVDAKGNVSWVADKNDATELVSDADGNFTAKGIEDGTYKLYETAAPSGYNLLTDPIELTVEATTANGQTWAGEPKKALTALKITVNNKTTDGKLDDGSVAVTIENSKGSVLPETGGVGTTIFYIVGSALVLGAAVLLITKKRMGSNK
ncbi:MAG: isopeptide-forming domain-containing fimbrial protein [Acutalibacteraceae bacterium]|nr:isopeptide-forming domain-containing fimbrial protein [Acutalibacteraceae bacterium]